jgi:S-adenosyl methyltransferase
MAADRHLNASEPHSARIYDFLLGGKDNFEADRLAAGQICQVMPHLPQSMLANRRFMVRTATRLAELGIRQFLDIGTGIPTSVPGVPNLHQAVQAVDPASRIVYVDNDPLVLAHARALLTGSPEGRIEYVDADLHDPTAILADEGVRRTLDFDEPVAVTLIAVMHYIKDEDEAYRIIDQFLAPLAPGSMLAISTTCPDSNPEETHAGVAAYNAQGIPCKARSIKEIAGLFRGLELTDPGVVLVNHWHPDPLAAQPPDEHVMIAGGVAVKR